MHNEQKVETRLPSAPILANPMLYVRPSSVWFWCLAFELCQPKDCCPSRAEGKLFGRLASVLWVLCACQCACLVALAILNSPPN